jgi:predicted ATPase
MLTRLQVRGFKNLVDVDVRFGPFTCIAGFNGVGKSNLFDAILFLRELAERPFVEAARAVRGGEDVRSLFTSPGDGLMTLAAELLIPMDGVDDFGQRAEASNTFVRYEVSLQLERQGPGRPRDEIRLVSEELSYITSGEARSRLGFEHQKVWRDSVIRAGRRASYLSTDLLKGVVKRHQDRPRTEGAPKGGGRTWEFPLATLPRTVLSSARNAQEGQTAVLVRQALRGARLLQLEPAALRRPDDEGAPDHLEADGSHLPATLYRLAGAWGSDEEAEAVYATLANRLAELLEGVGGIRIDRDEKRKLLTLMLKELQGPEFPASSLSDGTLRFLALAVLEMDSEETGVLCLEEPENGIHPRRIGTMLELLQDIAVDPNEAVGPTNPLRQVLVNTHSPAVVGQVPEGSLLFAEVSGKEAALRLRCVQGTWRTRTSAEAETIALGQVLAYLNPVPEASPPGKARVADYARREVRQLSLCFDPQEGDES